MKCSACQRRNSDTNIFCISCGTELAKELKRSKAFMPPQDLELSRRSAKLPAVRVGWQPLVAILLIIVIGLGATYYMFYGVDTYQVHAIDYQTIYD